MKGMKDLLLDMKESLHDQNNILRQVVEAVRNPDLEQLRDRDHYVADSQVQLDDLMPWDNDEDIERVLGNPELTKQLNLRVRAIHIKTVSQFAVDLGYKLFSMDYLKTHVYASV